MARVSSKKNIAYFITAHWLKMRVSTLVDIYIRANEYRFFKKKKKKYCNKKILSRAFTSTFVLSNVLII